MIAPARLRAALAIATAGLDVKRAANPLIQAAWVSACRDNSPEMEQAVARIENLGPRAVRLLLDRIADELLRRPRLVPTVHPADAWIARYTDCRVLGDYAGCTAVVASAGAALGEWTRAALVVAAHTVRAGAGR